METPSDFSLSRSRSFDIHGPSDRKRCDSFGSSKCGGGTGANGQNGASFPIFDYAAEILSSLNSLRINGLLTDITICSGKVSVKAHRVVLAAGSPYFRACFSSAFVEGSDDKKELILNNIEESALEVIIEYIYTGCIEIAEGNYLHLLDTANQLELPKLVNLCGEFLLSRLDVDNCLNIHSLAEIYSCTRLASHTEQFIFRHFEQIIPTDEFLQLTPERLQEYLSHDELSISQEETAFHAIVRWIKHDEINRAKFISNLLSVVRLELVMPQFVALSVHQCPYVKNDPTALQYVLDAYQWHCLPDNQKKSPRKQHLRSKAIRPCLYVFGGDDGHHDSQPYSEVICLDQLYDEWTTVAPLLKARSVCGSAVIGTKLYVVGGYDGERAMDSVEVFDCVENAWRSLPPISQRRCSCSCSVLDGKLYVVGGVCGPLALSQVECFDPESNTWTSVEPLSESRSACGVASINDCIYAVGGINSFGETVRSAEVYSLHTKTWREVASMCCPRRSFALCHWRGFLYAIGGNDGATDLLSVEMYDPMKNEWRMCEDMGSCRMYCSAATFGDCIYAAGGMDGRTTLRTMERYFPAEGRWEEVTPLPRSICGCGVQVLDIPLQAALLAAEAKSHHSPMGVGGGADGTILPSPSTPSPASPSPPTPPPPPHFTSRTVTEGGGSGLGLGLGSGSGSGLGVGLSPNATNQGNVSTPVDATVASSSLSLSLQGRDNMRGGGGSREEEEEEGEEEDVGEIEQMSDGDDDDDEDEVEGEEGDEEDSGGDRNTALRQTEEKG